MTALAGHAPAPVPVVVMQCQNFACPEAGYWVEVDLPALRFANSERRHVLCARCRRPLIPRTPRRP